MPNATGKGFVDNVLWGDDGKPLALVESKRTKIDAWAGQQQVKLYGDCVEAEYRRRPILFFTNGYEHWLWDDTAYPPRQVQGFLKKDELELLIQRRASKRPLASVAIDGDIVERYYQTRAIRRLGEAFEQDKLLKVLLVMATGAGKTRVVIASIDQLMRAGWVKRALFLADRVALVNQAVGAFKTHLPHVAPVNLVTDKDTEGRVYVSTYPTMMGLINEMKNGVRRFGTGHFDLIVIDEAHRSVYRRYRAIFDYFDSYLVGLTATPRDEIDRDTYSLFDLERGVPTDAYDLDEAVADGFLVPPIAVSVPLKFQREGIRYDDLSDEEKEQWDALEWTDDGDIPDKVDASALNKWLFNKEHFLVFDFCQNFGFFNQNPKTTDGALGRSLGERLFVTRVELIGEIQGKDVGEATEGLSALLAGLAERLHEEVAGMSLDNFIVRPKRRFVEKYQDKAAWQQLSAEDRAELAEHLAGLPSAYQDDDLAAKQFDYLLLSTQLAVLRVDPAFMDLKERIGRIAAKLEALANIPMVAAHLQLIAEVQDRHRNR